MTSRDIESSINQIESQTRTDNLTPEQRSLCMSKINSKNTSPELVVRKFLHKNGYRYRIHQVNLPGRPDIVLKRYKKIIFVHGCFWHMHNCRYGKVIPRSNSDYWKNKRAKNKMRDISNIKKLKEMGWDVLVIWECWIRRPEYIFKVLSRFLIFDEEMSDTNTDNN